MRARMSASSVTSQRIAVPPTSAATASISSTERAEQTTLAPSFA